MLLGIDTVTILLPFWRRQQALLLIEADRLRVDTRYLG
ncbi:merR family transcriptional regulator domain protein [Pseudomonas aeruginosa]|nr:merR family transcriptional regulator domain protein [Pseudomonas aeruginosa]PRW18064.1 merR family transcriptional regulator domain protein [Pseudomonas aeruginosa]